MPTIPQVEFQVREVRMETKNKRLIIVIAAVVGVDRATERLQTGQLISVNGSTGEIRVLNTEVGRLE